MVVNEYMQWSPIYISDSMKYLPRNNSTGNTRMKKMTKLDRKF